MRVLLAARPHQPSRTGGDRVVLDALHHQLDARGIDVVVAPDPRTVPPVDVIHLFNLDLLPATYHQVCVARALGVPYVITPLYWPAREAAPWHAHVGVRRRLIRHLPESLVDRLALWRAQHRQAQIAPVGRPVRSRQELRREILTHARAVLVTGQAERDRLLTDFPGLEPDRLLLAPLGYEPARPGPPTVTPPAAGFVLCVGAIGPRKNQLTLARALRGSGRRLVLIGSPAEGCAAYLRAVRRAAADDTVFLPDQPHGALVDFYRAASVVAQPSFIELPGLVAIEALAAGRPVVAADRPPVREYLDGLATFCDPGSPDSIRQACERAQPASPAAVDGFLRAHTWVATAEVVAAAYARALAPAPGPARTR